MTLNDDCCEYCFVNKHPSRDSREKISLSAVQQQAVEIKQKTALGEDPPPVFLQTKDETPAVLSGTALNVAEGKNASTTWSHCLNCRDMTLNDDYCENCVVCHEKPSRSGKDFERREKISFSSVTTSPVVAPAVDITQEAPLRDHPPVKNETPEVSSGAALNIAKLNDSSPRWICSNVFRDQYFGQFKLYNMFRKSSGIISTKEKYLQSMSFCNRKEIFLRGVR
jgi:hypothetical protein